MRFFIVSNELPPGSGVVLGRPDESRARAVALECLEEAQRHAGGRLWKDALRFRSVIPMVDLAVATADYLGKGPEAINHEEAVLSALASAYRQGLTEQRVEQSPWNVLGGALVSSDLSAIPGHILPFEQQCVTLMVMGGARVPVSSSVKLLCGVFASDAQLKGVLAEDGGNSRVHVFNRGVARGLFKRHGGGILEDGVYLMHPKRDDVLVPFRTFHSDMLQEMTREVRVVMGRIGARRLEVETVEGVTFSGSVVSRIPLKSGGVEMEAKEQSERRMTYEWASPTFEPERALEDCVWIRDNAGAMTIVDQRRTSDLSHFDEFSRVDTSFSVGINLMKLFETNFAWASTSTYRYSVDFFSRRGFHSLWKAMSPWNPRSDDSCDPKKEPT